MVTVQADSFEVSGNVTLTSDYSFRGWSQTTRDPAIQGGFDIEFEEGFLHRNMGVKCQFRFEHNDGMGSLCGLFVFHQRGLFL